MKILIIGQAPPAVKQDLPYDTTLLYEIFSWVGILKNEAQVIFEFEAMTDKFPGKGKHGHNKPSSDEMKAYFDSTLKAKIINTKKVIVLGNTAKETLTKLGLFTIKKHDQVFWMIHPSRRNYSKIMKQKDTLTSTLNYFLIS